ncbi:MAG: SDR family oxidoreductase [Alphaproteobacteria bacterium]|nr:SDR family oxidoreductase [Alphaproteobacteria bacterium]
MAKTLGGKTAIVTGASSGIGGAIARALAAEGAEVYAAGRTETSLKGLVDEIRKNDGKAHAAVIDVRDPVSINGLVDRAVKETGRINIMVNNAGLSYPDAIANGKFEHWKEMFETNVLALLAGSQAAIKAMRKGKFEGHIVNISSIGGRREGAGVYGATKAAVNMIGDTLRMELENDSIRVVQIMPGAVLTNFGRNFPPAVIEGLLKSMGESAAPDMSGKLPDEVIERAQAKAAQMFAHADDVARAVVYAVTQPITLNIYEMVVRPQRGLPDAVIRPQAK